MVTQKENRNKMIVPFVLVIFCPLMEIQGQHLYLTPKFEVAGGMCGPVVISLFSTLLFKVLVPWK